MANSPASEDFDAVILVGGRGTRLGGVDKAAVELGGRPLVSTSIAAARDARLFVVVGATNAPLPDAAIRAVEDPPGSGPAAGFVCGFLALTDPSPWTLLLSCDIPGAGPAVARLLAARNSWATHSTSIVSRAGDGGDGIVLTDPSGREQWTLGLYRTTALGPAIASGGPWANRPLRRLFDTLDLTRLAPSGAEWEDIDTWEAHARWQARLLD